MLPVLAACTTAAACDGAEIGPPLWVLATAMVGIFVLLIAGAIAIGAVYRHKSLNAVAARPARPTGQVRRAGAAPPAGAASHAGTAPPTGPAPHAGSTPPARPEAPWAHAGRRRR